MHHLNLLQIPKLHQAGLCPSLEQHMAVTAGAQSVKEAVGDFWELVRNLRKQESWNLCCSITEAVLEMCSGALPGVVTLGLFSIAHHLTFVI